MSSRRGVWVFIVLLTAVGALILAAAIRLQRPGFPAAPSTVLVFDVPAELDEGEVPFTAFGFDVLRRRRPTATQVVLGLEHAARDPNVAGLVLHVSELDWGWGKLSEVRDALVDFRASGKPVVASLTRAGDAEYFLASAASWISMPPVSTLRVDGLSETVLFLKGAFDKLDIRPHFAHAGRFKSAVESYTRPGMSPESREALEAVLDDAFAMLVDSLADARELPAAAVRRILDDGPYSAQEALAAGLVDTLVHDAEVDSLLALEIAEDAPLQEFSRYAARAAAARTGPRVGLIAAAGVITSGRSRFDPHEGQILGSESMIEALREARSRSAIRAVVLRIDSPGGEIGAADEIWREVSRLAETKPVVVSMSDLAASGGYYIAAPANRIVAQPATITGSIGVYGGKLNLLGLYRKLGLNVESASRGRHAEMMSPFTDFDGEEQRIFAGQIEESYRTFLDRVAEGRGITVEAADSLGQGRIWSGVGAWQRGLVDTLGGLPLAFRIALEEAGLPEARGYRIEPLPRLERGWLDRLLGDVFPGEDLTPPLPLPAAVRAWLAAARFPAGASLAMLPVSIEIR